jgi:hypothetical protein
MIRDRPEEDAERAARPMPAPPPDSYVRPVRPTFTSSGPRSDATIGRRALLGGTAAAVFATAIGCSSDDDDRPGRTGPSDGDSSDGDSSDGGSASSNSNLRWRGVNLDTDRELWRSAHVRREVASIADDLHCNAVFLLGHELGRLSEAADLAADKGLHVWFEPRQFNADAATTLDFVATVAEAAEELRADHPAVSLSLGVELTIFMGGLLPGADWSERAQALGTTAPDVYNADLNAFLADALPRIRGVFGGDITYSSGVWEQVDWSDFDVLGVDLYRDADNAATFVDDVRALHDHGKPVVITEFGCCAFRGAEDMGGNGFSVIDWTISPPVVPEGLVRDEQVQARYIEELLDVFEDEAIDGAFVYDFIEPGNPHTPDPRHDLDMAGFSLVTTFPTGHDRAYDTTGGFEPKAAFHSLARRFA